MKKTEMFKVEGDKISRQRRHCPKCGPGVFLAEHKNRISCGRCGYTEFKGKAKRPGVPAEKKPEKAEQESPEENKADKEEK